MTARVLPVVFIHGLIGLFADARTISLLPPTVVLTPDLLGYGSNAAMEPGRLTIDAQVAHLHTMADQAAHDTRIHLVAHSVGVVIAASFAYRFRDRVASFVNVEGNFALVDAF